MDLLHILLLMFFVQTFAVAFLLGILFTRSQNNKTQNVSNFSKHVDNPVDNLTPILQESIEKPAPKSVISKFPDPEKLRQQKDQQQVASYFKDLKSNPRESGTFVLNDLMGKND